ncbi:MAG TPA: BTAD domain-containing putative transcriptional regulator [Mycobacteriales bacterium]|nr:BTAD domain-containing putative transcriptional regulator [Mycobacteriales bacterium]
MVPPAADVRVLGPVSVSGPAGPAGLTGGRQRALVGVLALDAGHVVATSRLVDALWPDDPPRTAVRTLHSHAARVRSALAACGLPDAVVTRDPGYLLAVPREAVDALSFEDAVRAAGTEAAAGDPVAAAARLEAALALWRGEPLANGPVGDWAATEAERLHGRRVAAAEQLWEIRLGQGDHATAVTELDRLLGTYPTRERLVGLLMLGLYRNGCRADALERYERLRARLAEDYGTDPGPELSRLHTAILRGDPALLLHPSGPAPAAAGNAPAAPAQLPPPVGHFSGRGPELRRLDGWLAAPDGGPRLVLVRGPGGVGKTAFAVEWARSVRDRYPDGQLFLELRGHSRGTAVAPEDALGQALRALGVPADRIPAELPDQVSAYRSLVHDKRILLVLDNAADAAQVLPLVPTGDASLLVVTSRHELAALLVHHAVHLVDLGLLTGDEGAALLERVVGAERVRSERPAAAEVVELCGRLPLALRLAAAKLAGQPRRPIAELVTELAGRDRLAALSVDGDGAALGLRAVFASGYGALTPPAARLFRLLGLHPGVSVTGSLAAATAELPTTEAAAGLRELAAAHLLEDLGSGRYRFHDLLRLYAAERAAAEEPAPAREAAVVRILDWYLAVAAAANRILDPGRDRVTPARGPAELPFEATPAAALAFLDGEHANLLSIVAYAGREGHETAAWQLCYLLAGYFESRGHWGDRVAMYRLGLAAAQRLGDPAISGLMLSGLGVACIAARRHAEALEHLRPALELMRSSGDRRGEGHVHNNIAAALGELHRYGEAIESCERALEVHTANGHRLGMRLALNNLGCAHARVGEVERGIAYLERGLRLARDDGDRRLEAGILHSLGETHRGRGAHREALDALGQALRLRRRLGERRYEVETLIEISRARLDAGEPGPARDHALAAHRLGVAVGDQHLEAVAAAQLGRAQLAAGDRADARGWLLAAAELRRRIPDRPEEAVIRAGLAELSGPMLTPSR